MDFEPMSQRTPSSPSEPSGRPPNEHPLTRVFLGPDGLRVGWRLVIAVSFWFALSGILPMLVIWIPGVRHALRNVARGPIVMTPVVVLVSDGITAAAALLTALIMTRIEKRSFAAYGLPGRAAFGKRFWQGVIFGLAMISVLMGLIAALHGYSVSGVDLRESAALRYGLLYFAGFIAVALFEEFSFRGYLQSTLQLATGFWPAALVLAVMFGAIHLTNPGEGAYGVAMAGAFGLLAAFTLWRTGDIWFAIGLHAAWDWGETYLYSVRDSGVPARGHLLRSAFHGPNWLTGGSIGPEGSALVFVVLALAVAGVHVLLPRRKRAS